MRAAARRPGSATFESVRRGLLVLVCVLALTTPTAGAWAAAHAKAGRQRAAASGKTSTVLGTTVICNRSNQTILWSQASPGAKASAWGPLQLKLTYRKTGKKITILNVEWPVWPQHTVRSVFINEKALPLLQQEVLQLQSANIETVAGATNISLSFKKSLLAALALAAKS